MRRDEEFIFRMKILVPIAMMIAVSESVAVWNYSGTGDWVPPAENPGALYQPHVRTSAGLW